MACQEVPQGDEVVHQEGMLLQVVVAMQARRKTWPSSLRHGRKKKRRMVDKATIHKPSVMARYLLESWGFGLKSARTVQKEAAMAVADGATHEELMALAQLGNAVHDDFHGPESFESMVV